uniref:Ig-like domain-containing protein n=1 Tax=Xiphophorus maculatus TaxID=8083 RepID=A0A3B5QMJ4_XIPMA
MVRSTRLLCVGYSLVIVFFYDFCLLSNIISLLSGVLGQIKLEQSPSVVKKPGEAAKLSCSVNGFDKANEFVHWTRQKTGKTLEWIGRQSLSWQEYSSSFQSRFTLSYDVSSSSADLSIRSLTEEDSALYFCAHTHCDALDYWGEGTRVTVTSGASCTPKLTVLSVTTGDGQTLVCVIEDFSSENLLIKWKRNSNEVSGHNEWPPKKLGDSYSAASVLKLKSSDWDSDAVYSCEVTHLGKTYTKKASKDQIFNVTSPITVTLKPLSPKKMFNNNQAELECVVSGQDNDIVSGTEITWEINGELMRSKIKEATMFEGSKHSIITFNSSDWRTVSKVRCSAAAEDVGPVIQDLTVNKGDGTEPKVTVHVLPEKDIGQEASAQVTLVCLVSSDVLQDYYIAWTEDVGQSSSVYYDGIDFPPRKTKNGYSVVSVYATNKDKWSGGYVFYCNVWPAGRGNRMKPSGVSRAMGNATECGDEDEYSSLWFTASSFLSLFIFSLSYSLMLTLKKEKKQQKKHHT